MVEVEARIVSPCGVTDPCAVRMHMWRAGMTLRVAVVRVIRHGRRPSALRCRTASRRPRRPRGRRSFGRRFIALLRDNRERECKEHRKNR
jgi:hypothetical protein